MEIAVFGMTCGKCEARVEAALAAVAGVSQIQVNRERNQVYCHADETLRPEVEAAIVGAGYNLEQHHDPVQPVVSPDAVHQSNENQPNHIIRLEIGGMTCASCVAAVERALRSVANVQNVEVNYASGSAQVFGDTDSATLISAVRRAGYSARTTEAEKGSRGSLKRNLILNVLRSLFALVPGAILMFSPDGLVNLMGWLGIGLLVLAVLVVTGGRYYRACFSALKHGQVTMDTLVSLGTGSAWSFSMLVILAPGLIDQSSQHLFFEAALFIIGFVHLGKSIEEYARGQASNALDKLLDLSPKFANRLEVGDRSKWIEVSIKELRIGDEVLIRAGEAVPADGVVVDGNGSVDEQMITGESLPVHKQCGENLTGGTINLEGTLVSEITDIGESTVLGRMVRAVQQAQNSKPQIAHMADEISAWFVPFVIVFAIASAAAWWISGAPPEFVLGTFMTTLIVACPCALGLAIPMSVIVGLGRAAKLGFLVRHSDSLQKAAKVDVIVLDKTGTLTEGRPEVSEILLADGAKLETLSSIALGLELNSIHPLALAVQTAFSNAERIDLQDVKTYPGQGVIATYNGRQCILGNARFLAENGYDEFPDPVPVVGSLVYVGLDGDYLGLLSVSDKLRPDAAVAIQQFKQQGITPLLLSGDRPEVVAQVATEIGIHEYHGGLGPGAKQEMIETKQSMGSTVAMVGDGINDALALSQADVGIAMGAGSDIAIESADVTLMRHELILIADAFRLSGKVVANIKQNLGAAFIYNVCLIPVAAGLLYPTSGVLLEPSYAGLAMALSSISVVTNAARLRLMA